MNVGDLVRELVTGETGIIIRVKPLVNLSNGVPMIFDYQILSDGNIFYVDADEIEKVQ